jgi:hypothetical protein
MASRRLRIQDSVFSIQLASPRMPSPMSTAASLRIVTGGVSPLFTLDYRPLWSGVDSQPTSLLDLPSC